MARDGKYSCFDCKHEAEPVNGEHCDVCCGSETHPNFLLIDSNPDSVSHPSHYTHGKIECIDAIASAVYGLSGFDGMCTGNAIKYLWRWRYKNGVEDLKKAKWYIDKLIEQEEKRDGRV